MKTFSANASKKEDDEQIIKKEKVKETQNNESLKSKKCTESAAFGNIVKETGIF